MSVFDYHRRKSSVVHIGDTPLGGSNPIRVQSMASTPTIDTEKSVAQGRRIIEAGAEYLRYTAQGVREAANLGEIRRRLRQDGFTTPLVADIHFNPRAAFEAATQVEKVRINPGNFVDPGRTFKKIEFTDREYALELERIDKALTPFLELCRQHGTALRIGVNHGSLSDRIMSRYGDTPAGMVESAMEFLRVCRKREFTDVVISIKASNVTVMVETVRRLIKAMDRADMHFPIHLGVTEAGDGDDGRIKSAVGIGALLAEGIGDTIRVSLSENPEYELPVAREIVDYIARRDKAPAIPGSFSRGYDPVAPDRRKGLLPTQTAARWSPVVVGPDSSHSYPADLQPDLFSDTDSRLLRLTASDILADLPAIDPGTILIVESDHPNPSGEILAAIHHLSDNGITNPIVIGRRYDNCDATTAAIHAAIDCGTILMAGFGDGLLIEGNAMTPEQASKTAFAILQAARLRFSHTEYISCPGCGRTLFDLQSTLAEIKRSTSHLKDLKIGVMGCIVNGPGEMADADYGYVGAGVGNVSLYRGKECVRKNISATEAVESLIDLIKSDGRWTDPA